MLKNQVKAGALLSYLQIFIGIIISISINRIVVSNLGQSEYGLMNLASSTLSYLNLLTLGVGSAFVRYNMKYRVAGDVEGERKLNGIFLILFAIISILMAVFGTILIGISQFIFPKLTADENRILQIIMIITLIQSCISVPVSIFVMNINAYEKFIFAKLVGIINTVLAPIGKLIIVLLGYKAIGISVVVLLLSILTALFEIIYAVKKVGVRFKFGKIDTKLIKSIYAFSAFIFLNQIIDMVNWQVDKLILGVTSGAVAISIYGLGASLNNYVMNFSTAILGVLTPRVNKMVASGESKEEITNIFIKTGRVQFIILALIMLGLVFFGKPFIENIYATNEYSESYYVALLLILPLIVPLIQNVGVEIQRAYNKHKFRSIAYAIMALLNLAMSIPLGMKYGAIGCAIGTCVSLIVGNGFIMNWYYHYKLGLNMKKFWWSIIKFVPSLIIPCVLGSLLMLFVDLSVVWLFFVCIVAFILVYAISMFFLGINRDERKVVISKIKKVLIIKDKEDIKE